MAFSICTASTSRNWRPVLVFDAGAPSTLSTQKAANLAVEGSRESCSMCMTRHGRPTTNSKTYGRKDTWAKMTRMIPPKPKASREGRKNRMGRAQPKVAEESQRRRKEGEQTRRKRSGDCSEEREVSSSDLGLRRPSQDHRLVFQCVIGTSRNRKGGRCCRFGDLHLTILECNHWPPALQTCGAACSSQCCSSA